MEAMLHLDDVTPAILEQESRPAVSDLYGNVLAQFGRAADRIALDSGVAGAVHRSRGV